MKIGPKFKIAKRLGAPIFEKTQTQKFALASAKGGSKTTQKRPGQMSDYKRQLIEKQKMRFTYGITEKQLRRYVDEALKKSTAPVAHLLGRLEGRLDNTVYRLGLAKTRRFARQIVSHGHIVLNGKRLNIPSHEVKVGDKLTIREGSKQSVLFSQISETHEGVTVPAWLAFDAKTMTGTVTAIPAISTTETLFDPEQVFEFYSR